MSARENGRPRDLFASQVCPAMRQAIEREIKHLAEKRNTGRTRVFLAALYLVPSYSRLDDFVYVAQVAEVARLSERQTRRWLDELAAEGEIDWHPQRGQGRKSRLGLPRVGESGRLERPVSEGAEVEKPVANGGENRSLLAMKPVALEVPRTEKDREVTEEKARAADAENDVDGIPSEQIVDDCWKCGSRNVVSPPSWLCDHCSEEKAKGEVVES